VNKAQRMTRCCLMNSLVAAVLGTATLSPALSQTSPDKVSAKTKTAQPKHPPTYSNVPYETGRSHRWLGWRVFALSICWGRTRFLS